MKAFLIQFCDRFQTSFALAQGLGKKLARQNKKVFDELQKTDNSVFSQSQCKKYLFS